MNVSVQVTFIIHNFLQPLVPTGKPLPQANHLHSPHPSSPLKEQLPKLV